MGSREDSGQSQHIDEDIPKKGQFGREGKPIIRRPPKSVVTKRIETVTQMMIQGASHSEMWQYVEEKTDWGISERTLRRYKSKANKVIEEQSKVNIDRELGLAIRRLNYLFAKTIHLQDYKGALAVQKELNELLGLKTLKIQLVSDDLKEKTPEELEEMIKEIEDKYIKQLAPGVTLNTKPT